MTEPSTPPSRARSTEDANVEPYDVTDVLEPQEHETPRNKSARVRICLRIMVEDQWTDGVTGPALAKLWKLSAGTLEDDAARASEFRRLMHADDVQYLQKRGMQLFEEALMQLREMPYGTKDRVRETRELLGTVFGRMLPQRIEHSGPGGAPLSLPPVIAALNPSREELEHFVLVDAAACTVAGCRIHVATKKLLEGNGDAHG